MTQSHDHLDEFLDSIQTQLTQHSSATDNLLDDTKTGYYIGMMSGTSLDGLDVVLCQFEPTRLIATHSQPFDDTLKAILLALCQPDGITTLDKTILQQLNDHKQLVSELDFFGLASQLYARLCVTATENLLAKANLDTHDITAIGVHGQTIRHRPNLAFSLQLLDPNILAEMTGISVVSDFRRRDMAVGGQGAPLVPAFHQAIFGTVNSPHDHQTIVLNLGGIANITVLDKTVLGYDTGVANLLMDAWIQHHLGKDFDKNGDWAKLGKVNQNLLDKLLMHQFLALPAPKSTGREDFNRAWLDEILANFDTAFAPQDVQATLCEFTAVTAAQAIQKHQKAHNTLYVCGGGAYNGYLLDRLQVHLPDWTITTTDSLGIAPTWVEAMCFAWLARQTLLGETGNLPSVTGAKRAVVLGQVCFG